VAETFVAMPFLVLTMEAAFRSADHALEDAARTLGAGRFAVFPYEPSRNALRARVDKLLDGDVLGLYLPGQK